MDQQLTLTSQFDPLIRLLAQSAADKWLKSQDVTKIKKDTRNVKSMPVRAIQHR